MQDIKDLGDLMKYFNSSAFIGSAVVVIIASVLLWLIKQYLVKKVAYTTKDDQHKNTFIGMIFNVLQYLVIVLSIVIIMKLHGVDIASIMAGLGIVGMIIGLALQDTLKDIISGINIYNNNFYKVGDMVRWNDEECDVKYFSARVTKFQSLKTNSTYTVCNSQIHSIEKIKDRHIATYLFPYDRDKEAIDAVMLKIAERMKEECKPLKNIRYDGICSIEPTGVIYEIKYTCAAHKTEQVKDMLSAISYEEFKKSGVAPGFSSMYK